MRCKAEEFLVPLFVPGTTRTPQIAALAARSRYAGFEDRL